MCLLRWSERANDFSQREHAKGLTPVCERTWRASSSERENCQAQSFQVHLKGFSPVWRRRCALRCELFVYVFAQPFHVQVWMMIWPSCISGLGCRRCLDPPPCLSSEGPAFLSAESSSSSPEIVPSDSEPEDEPPDDADRLPFARAFRENGGESGVTPDELAVPAAEDAPELSAGMSGRLRGRPTLFLAGGCWP